MIYLKTFKIFEKNIPKSDRLEIYRDSNIVIIAPLTHDAQKKYGIYCQWCINSDFYEWDEYHKGSYVLIIQRKPIKNKIGISGRTIAEEIYAIEQGSFQYDFDFSEVEITEDEYFDKITKDINNFDLNTVYYSNGIIFDKQNNSILEYNRDNNGEGYSKFRLDQIPNITQKAIKKVKEYLKQ